MFVYSMHGGTLKFLSILGVALLCLVALMTLVPRVDAEASTLADTASYHYDKIKSADDVKTFLAQFGWKVKDGEPECVKVVIPEEFDKIFTAYNDIQRAQGLDLAKYKRKEVTRYTFEIENYAGYDAPVLANVLVYRGKVIGGDVCSADVKGFISGFEGKADPSGLSQ